MGTGDQGCIEWVETDLDAIGKGKGKGRSCYNCEEVGHFSRECDKSKGMGKEVTKGKERTTKERERNVFWKGGRRNVFWKRRSQRERNR